MRKVILRTARHELVMAFECQMVNLFLEGPAAAPPEIVFWGSRVFSFSTLDDDSVTFSEAFAFSLVEGATATQLSASEIAKIKNVEPDFADQTPQKPLG